MCYEGAAIMWDPSDWKLSSFRVDDVRARAKRDEEERRDDDDDDDDGPSPSATAVVTRFLPFLRPVPRLVPTV